MAPLRPIVTRHLGRPRRSGGLTMLTSVPSEPAPTTYFTNFSEYATGQAPSDWSQPWVQSAGWSVVADAAATGGKILRHTTADTTAWRGLKWDKVPATADVEIVFKWRNLLAGRGFVRGGGTEGVENAYYGTQRSNSSISLGMRVAGAQTFPITGANASFATNTANWYCTRLRVNGTTFTGRTWLASDTEPDTWQLTYAPATELASGWVGLLGWPSSVNTAEFDWFGVGLNGEAAPTS